MAEAQILGEHVLRAEARMGGKMLDAIPLSEKRASSARELATLPAGISYYAQQLAKHPEAIKEGIKKAKDLGEIPTSKGVLRLTGVHHC